MSVASILVAGWSAQSARRSASAAERSAAEAFKTRLDQSGPAVVLESEKAFRRRWIVGMYRPPDHTPPGEAKPDMDLDMPGNSDARILIGAHLSFRNEGARTCRVTVSEAFRVDRADGSSKEALEAVLSPEAEMPDTWVPDGTIAIEPGQTAGMIIRVGPTLAEWLEDGDHPYTAKVAAVVDRDGARQEWAVSLDAALLSGNPHNASRFRVLPNVPPDLRVEEQPRVYPHSTYGE